MEFLQELFLTAFVAVLLSFLVAKLISIAVTGDPGVVDLDEISRKEGIIREELQLRHEFESQGVGSEKKVEFVEGTFEKVDQFKGECSQMENTVEKRHNQGEETEKECCELAPEVAEEVMEGETVAAELPGKLEEEVVVEREEKTFEVRNDRKEVEESSVNDVVVEKPEVEVVEADPMVINEEKSHELDIEYDDDDWEGIERTELEKVFAAAVKYVEEKGNLASIGSDLQMELYGLYKIATEGSCLEPQPMALKVFARSKWNAWQKMGTMNPEVAMEQYIALLSNTVSGWSGESYDEKNELESAVADKSCPLAPDPATVSEDQTTSIHESYPGLKSDIGRSNLHGASSLHTRVWLSGLKNAQNFNATRLSKPLGLSPGDD